MTDAGLAASASTEAKRRALVERALREKRARTARPPDPGPRSLLPLRASGSRPPLFLVHAVGGSAAPYAPLVELLDPRQPVYGLESPGLYGEGQPVDRFDLLAASYVGLIRQVQPHGPYLIGGWSIGGVIAIEMAVRLRSAGEETALLVMLDSGVPPAPDELPDQAELLDDFVQDVAALRSAHPPRPDLAALRRLAEADQVETVITALEQDGLVPGSVRNEVRHRFAIFAANACGYLRYQPVPFDVPVTLIEAADSPIALEPQWRPLARAGLVHHTVSGTHHTILQPPHINDLAGTMRHCLDSAAPPRGRSPWT